MNPINQKRPPLESIFTPEVMSGQPKPSLEQIFSTHPQLQPDPGEIPGTGGITPNQQASNREALGGLISHFPGQELGHAVGNSIYGIGQFLQGNFGEAEAAADENAANMGRVIGDTANAVATPASFALAPGASVAKNALTYGALGAVQGGGRSLAVGNDAATAAKDAFKSGLTSAVVAGALTGITNKIDQWANKSPEHIYDNALKVKQRIKNAGQDPSKFLSDNKVWGNLGSIKKASDEGIQSANANIRSAIEQRQSTIADTISNHLTSSKQVLDNMDPEQIQELGGMPELLNRTKTNIVDALKSYGIKDVAKSVDGINVYTLSSLDDLSNQVNAVANAGHTYQGIKQLATDKLASSLGGLYSKPEIEALVERVPVAGLRDAADGNLSIGLLDQVRSKLGTLIGNSKWTMTNPSENVKAAQAMYRALSDTVKDATGTTNEFAKLSNWINAQKVVDSAIDLADGKFGIGLRDQIGIGAGLIAGAVQPGSLSERIKHAGVGAMLGFGSERLGTSPTIQTGMAQGLNALAPHVQEIGRAAKAGANLLTTSPSE